MIPQSFLFKNNSQWPLFVLSSGEPISLAENVTSIFKVTVPAGESVAIPHDGNRCYLNVLRWSASRNEYQIIRQNRDLSGKMRVDNYQIDNYIIQTANSGFVQLLPSLTLDNGPK